YINLARYDEITYILFLVSPTYIPLVSKIDLATLFFVSRRTRISTLFPYTTLFRSNCTTAYYFQRNYIEIYPQTLKAPLCCKWGMYQLVSFYKISYYLQKFAGHW